MTSTYETASSLGTSNHTSTSGYSLGGEGGTRKPKRRVRFPDDSSSSDDNDNPIVVQAVDDAAAATSTESKPNSEKPKVELARIVCEIPHREDWSEEEHAALFFSRSDYHMSRSAAKVISKESERYGYSRNLEDTYTEKSPEIQDKLNQWVLNGSHCRRGLERWCHTSHGEKRQHDQFHAIMTVLRAQDDMISKKNCIDHEKLRKISHKATKTSRHFARMMGKADSYAMAQELKAEAAAARGDADTASVTEAMTNATVGSNESRMQGGQDDPDDAMTVDTFGGDSMATSSTDAYEMYANMSMPSLPPIDPDLDLVQVDELKDSSHAQANSQAEKLRRRVFGAFGRKPKGERISRVA